jgi:hypothetical protein
VEERTPTTAAHINHETYVIVRALDARADTPSSVAARANTPSLVAVTTDLILCPDRRRKDWTEDSVDHIVIAIHS